MYLRSLSTLRDMQGCASPCSELLKGSGQHMSGAGSPKALSSEPDACMRRLPSSISRMRRGGSMGHGAPRAASSGRAQPGAGQRRPRPTNRAPQHTVPGRLPARASQPGGAGRSSRSKVIRADISRVHGQPPCPPHSWRALCWGGCIEVAAVCCSAVSLAGLAQRLQRRAHCRPAALATLAQQKRHTGHLRGLLVSLQEAKAGRAPRWDST